MAFVFLSFKYDRLCMHLEASGTVQTMSIGSLINNSAVIRYLQFSLSVLISDDVLVTYRDKVPACPVIMISVE